MKYRCDVVKDLLPLYVDDVCSNESKKIVNEHIEECDSCRQYYNTIVSSDRTIILEDVNNEIMADSLKKVKKQIKLKNMIAISGTLVVVLAFSFISIIAVIGLQHMDYIVPYSEDITLIDKTPEEWSEWYTDRDDQLIIRSKGKKILGMLSEYVEIEDKGETEKVIFFHITTTPWYDIITGNDEISYQFLSNVEVDKIYYYPGYMMDIEAIADGELQVLIESSTLMWEK